MKQLKLLDVINACCKSKFEPVEEVDSIRPLVLFSSRSIIDGLSCQGSDDVKLQNFMNKSGREDDVEKSSTGQYL